VSGPLAAAAAAAAAAVPVAATAALAAAPGGLGANLAGEMVSEEEGEWSEVRSRKTRQHRKAGYAKH
jgi:hypothetical protein